MPRPWTKATRNAITAALGSLTIVCAATCASEGGLPRKIAVDDFELRECKTSSSIGKLATGAQTEDFAGLECVAWRLSTSATDIDLINWTEGCGFQGFGDEDTKWKAELEQTASNAIELGVFWDFEGPSACGSCLHDFSISAESIAASDQDLRLVVATRSCTDDDVCDWTEKLTKLDGKQGIQCRYVDWSKHTVKPQNRGKLGNPTRDGECDEPLVATEINGEERCLKRCSSDDDCQSPQTCQNNTCQLR